MTKMNRGTTTTRLGRLAATAAAFGLATIALAHEFWLEPSNFRPKIDENVAIRHFVGDGFPGEPRPRDPRRLEKFVVAGAAWESPIPGEDGKDPAGVHRFSRPGVQVLGYRSTNVMHTMEPEKFEKYLAEEGLSATVKIRADRGESAKPGRELFSRCAKSIVRVGDPVEGDRGFERSLKMPVEITPVENPYTKTAGMEYSVLVTQEGKPAANAAVKVFCKHKPGVVLDITTDEHGVAKFTPDTPGMYLIGNVYMRPALNADGTPKKDADWESLWGSLTFEVLPKVPESAAK